MPDLMQQLPELLAREAVATRLPALAGIRTRSRHRRQRLVAGAFVGLALVAVPAGLLAGGASGSRPAQVATTEHESLDAYLQTPADLTSGQRRITGDPVEHLRVVSAVVGQDPTTGERQLRLVLDEAGRSAFAAFRRDDLVAFAVGERLLAAPVFQTTITSGELTLTGVFASQAEASAVAHLLTDNVVVDAD
jgi:preprotein translocase subunit SecD